MDNDQEQQPVVPENGPDDVDDREDEEPDGDSIR